MHGWGVKVITAKAGDVGAWVLVGHGILPAELGKASLPFSCQAALHSTCAFRLRQPHCTCVDAMKVFSWLLHGNDQIITAGNLKLQRLTVPMVVTGGT